MKNIYIITQNLGSNRMEGVLPKIEKVKKEEVTIDLAKSEELKYLFNESVDDFDKVTWVQPKSSPRYRNQNGFYCYFQKTKDNKVSNLRFVGQYEDDDELFIERVKFNIDGEIYEYYPLKIYSDYDSRIWEWFDDRVSGYNSHILEAIASAKSVKVRFIGE